MRTRRWTRSPRGKIFGVATGLAEWRELDPAMTRIIVFLIIFFTGVFPGVAIYLGLALILPAQKKSDIIDDDIIDVHYEEAEENVNMKSDYDREKDWDERFRKEK